MKNARFFYCIVLALGALAAMSGASSAQFGRSHYTSPKTHAENTIAGHRITIDYYSPSMHDRTIFGGLVPYDVVWCTGANWATEITSDANLQMGNLKIPKGSHTIWTIPNPKQWTLIINNQVGQFHLDYDESQDLGRTKMNIRPLDVPVEAFKIEIRPDGGDKGTLALDWERTEAYMPFRVGQ